MYKAPPPTAPGHSTPMNYVVDLPVDDNSCGLSFAGIPPQISAVLRDFPSLQGHNVIGCYVTAFQMPGVEISGFADSKTLEQLLQLHQHVSPRRLVLSTHPPTCVSNQGLLYRHDLPGNQDLGITFDGFPAKVAAVDKLSVFSGRILPGQFVDSVVVPGSADLNFQSGGFTGHRVTQYIRETAKVAGRQIVIKDYPINITAQPGYTEYDQSDPFDFGGFRGNWFRRQRTTPSKKKF
jgi:hypothetical protein